MQPASAIKVQCLKRIMVHTHGGGQLNKENNMTEALLILSIGFLRPEIERIVCTKGL